MDVGALLADLESSASYRGQVAAVHRIPARAARYGGTERPMVPAVERMLAARGIGRLYSHQAEAVDRVSRGENVLLATGTASGKSLGYVIPIVEALTADPSATGLLLFPTKALCQDQFRGFADSLHGAGMERVLAGVYDGDTPAPLRRKLRDQGAVLFSNPDMLHSALMPQHGRWAPFLSRLRYLVVDELHTYNGMFGSNMANVLRRLYRICAQCGSNPQLIACSATIGNPVELAERLTGRPWSVVDDDGSPRGAKTYLFWNPPVVRGSRWRSRRSANVEAHELAAELIRRGAPTIVFSKAKMAAEMIHRYVVDRLRETAPHLMDRVCAYRGGYLPEERRAIERRLFAGELMGVSATPALELGIDVGALDASVLVGYPGALASFFQQSGRAGRKERESLAVLVGLDTTVNQYVMRHPEYVFGRPVEHAVIDPDNPYVLLGHMRCAAHEIPLREADLALFGPHAEMVLRILEGNLKVKLISGTWYHSASETPQHEVPLRGYADANVMIEDAETGLILGELNEYDAPPILHPESIYIHHGETYRTLSLDMERRVARVKREQTDYYTQPLGGTDVHHVDHCLREKPFGTGIARWGEVTSYFQTYAYERIHFYSLDAISQHGVDLPALQLETMALWLIPPEDLMIRVRRAGLDPFNGLRGIGYATRMMLPLFVTCDTSDFSHSVGAANAPWNSLFIYERHPHGLGFTEKAFDRLHLIMPAVLEGIRGCGCAGGCPCCVGKPLRQFTTWNVERGEGSVPSKRAAVMVLDGLLEDGTDLSAPDSGVMANSKEAYRIHLEQSLRRRLEREREPHLFHPIEPHVPVGIPASENTESLAQPDVVRRLGSRAAFEKELRKRMAQGIQPDGLPPAAPRQAPPKELRASIGTNPPSAYEESEQTGSPPAPIKAGDSLASRARRLKQRQQ